MEKDIMDFLVEEFKKGKDPFGEDITGDVMLTKEQNKVIQSFSNLLWYYVEKEPYDDKYEYFLWEVWGAAKNALNEIRKKKRKLEKQWEKENVKNKK